MQAQWLISSCTMLIGVSAPLVALELDPALRVGGFVDAVGLVGIFDDNNRGGNAAFGPGDHVAPIFKAQAELQVGGIVEEEFGYQIDYEVFNDGRGGSGARLEQAYARWMPDEQWALKAGRFEDWIGFERQDSPTWYRTRLSPLAQLWHGIAETGVNATWRPRSDWRCDVYVVNGIWSELGNNGAGGASKEAEDIGYGVSTQWRGEGVGQLSLGAAYDAGTHVAQTPGDSGNLDTWSVFLCGGWDAWRERHGFFGFWDLEYVDYDEFAGYGATLGAVQDLTPKLAIGLAVTWIDPNDSDEAFQNPYNTLTTGTNPTTGVVGGTYGRDDELMEYCLSLHGRPTGSKHVIVNAEVAWQDHVQERADVVWVDLQLIVVIP